MGEETKLRTLDLPLFSYHVYRDKKSMNGNYLEGRKDYDKLDDQAEFAILKRKYFHNLTKKKTNIQRYNNIIVI